MIDEETDLRERFAELRAEERSGVPRFEPRFESRFQRRPRERRRPVAWGALAATAALLLVAILTVMTRPRPTRFSPSDRAVVRSVAEWHPPTDFLLRTPGSEMLRTTPQIPDPKGMPR